MSASGNRIPEHFSCLSIFPIKTFEKFWESFQRKLKETKLTIQIHSKIALNY